MDFGQLEKWCANELSGMSKSRILCILNGKPMLESSDTSETDDSGIVIVMQFRTSRYSNLNILYLNYIIFITIGPSLEIISDTEEWFTDEDISKKDEVSKTLKGKIKKERIKQKGKSQVIKKIDSKKVPDNTYKNVQIKKEDDTDKNKEKEADSLLDLLELEMRARAIRALIRKEEDIIPNTSKSVTDNDISNKTAAAKAEQDEIKEKENCRRQLERIISAQQNTAEDEDVVLVVQPTPTIELLSSDSEGEPHSGVRVNKKLQNERVIENEDNINHIENRDLNNVHNINSIENSKEDNIIKSSIETHQEVNSTQKNEILKRIHSNNALHKDNQSKSSSKRRKTKKKSHIKEQSKDITFEVNAQSNVSQNIIDIKNNDCSNIKLNDEKEENNVKHDNSSPNKQNSIETLGISSKVTLDEEKSIDLDEIIDLDNYCDDMDDIENNENDKNNQIVENKQSNPQTTENSSQKSNATETWASRYYQTDDVQSVIKESKIQSEIRKRLRERQRLSKLNTSPKNPPSSPPTIETTNNKVIEKHPMGSVDEYLALKHTAATNLIDSSCGSNTIKDKADINRPIENDLVYSKNQKIDKDKESNLNDNINIDDTVITKHEKIVNTINVNPG